MTAREILPVVVILSMFGLAAMIGVAAIPVLWFYGHARKYGHPKV